MIEAIMNVDVLRHIPEVITLLLGILALLMHLLLLDSAQADMRVLERIGTLAKPSQLRFIRRRLISEKMHCSKGIAIMLAAIVLMLQDIPEGLTEGYWIPRMVAIATLAFIASFLALDAHLTRRDLKKMEEEERALAQLAKTQPWSDPERWEEQLNEGRHQ